MTLASPATSPSPSATSAVTSAAALVGLVVVRGGGAPVVQRRLPRRAPASIGSRDRSGFLLDLPWVPRDLGTFSAVDEGWLFHNTSRARMRFESDFIAGGVVVLVHDAIAMLQRGDHRISWEGLQRPIGVSVTVRTRRLEDQRIPFAVDSTVGAREGGSGSYLGVTDAPMSTALRYRLAMLYRHLLSGEPEPRNALQHAAETLGIPVDDLAAAAHRYRRRLNVGRGLDLQSLEDLGEYLVQTSQELGHEDLEP